MWVSLEKISLIHLPAAALQSPFTESHETNNLDWSWVCHAFQVSFYSCWKWGLWMGNFRNLVLFSTPWLVWYKESWGSRAALKETEITRRNSSNQKSYEVKPAELQTPSLGWVATSPCAAGALLSTAAPPAPADSCSYLYRLSVCMDSHTCVVISSSSADVVCCTGVTKQRCAVCDMSVQNGTVLDSLHVPRQISLSACEELPLCSK